MPAVWFSPPAFNGSRTIVSTGRCGAHNPTASGDGEKSHGARPITATEINIGRIAQMVRASAS
jgi:hypothetical protein